MLNPESLAIFSEMECDYNSTLLRKKSSQMAENLDD